MPGFKRRLWLQPPGAEDLGVGGEVLEVAGDDGEAVALGGGHEQGIHDRQGLARQFGPSGELGPGLKRGGIEGEDATGKALLHRAQPVGEFLTAAGITGAQLDNPLFDLAQGDDADKQADLVLPVQPYPINQLRCEYFCKDRQHFSLCFGINFPELVNQARLINGPDLVKNHLSILTIERTIHSCRVVSAFRGHGSNDNRSNITVRFVW